MILKIYSRTLHTLYPKTIVGEVRPRFGKENIIHGSGKNFTHRSTMTLTVLSFDFKTWFNEQNIIHKVVSYCMFLLFSGTKQWNLLKIKEISKWLHITKVWWLKKSKLCTGLVHPLSPCTSRTKIFNSFDFIFDNFIVLGCISQNLILDFNKTHCKTGFIVRVFCIRCSIRQVSLCLVFNKTSYCNWIWKVSIYFRFQITHPLHIYTCVS